MFYSENDLTLAKYGVVKERKYDIAILPWGATEPHGPHIPYGTDSMITSAIGCLVADEAQKQGVNVLVLPSVPFGEQNPGQAQLTGCINASATTILAIFADIVESLQRQGITKLVVFNGHGGNTFVLKTAIRDFAIRYPAMTIAMCEYFKICKDKSKYFSEKIDDHAGEEETSLMLKFFPEVVRMDLAGSGELIPFALESLREGYGWLPRHWDKATVDTAVGCAKKASAESADAYLAEIMPKIVQLVVELATQELY